MGNHAATAVAAWVQQWQLEEMYAGVRAGGADVAWMSTALDTEEAMADRVHFILSLLDVWKCFDQIIPLLVQMLAGKAGMPTESYGPT